MIKLKRVYADPSPTDGLRVLVERLWPRGLTKRRAAVDLWLKDIAPSPELRKWFGHDPRRWSQFQTRYRKELQQNQNAVRVLQGKVRAGPVTLVYAARDEEHNGALVLRKALLATAITPRGAGLAKFAASENPVRRVSTDSWRRNL